MAENPGLTQIADQIFDLSPAVQRSGITKYVHSTTFDRNRRGLIEHDSSLAPYYENQDLSRELENRHELGPYERQLLSCLLGAPNNQILIVGPRGSGKTSSIQYLLQIYSECRRQVPLEQEPVNNVLRAVSRMKQCYIYIDLKPLANNLAHKERDGVTQADLIEVLKTGLRDYIGTSVKKHLDQEQSARRSAGSMLVDIIEELKRSNLLDESAVPLSTFDAAITKFTNLLAAEGRKPKVSAQVAAIQRTLHSMDLESQIQFWFAVIDFIAQSTAISGGKFFVILDNSDPMSGFLQRRINEQFLPLSPLISFKLVIPTRVASAYFGWFDQPYNWYPHCGPSPAEVVSYRLSAFLNNPNLSHTFGELAQPTQSLAICRAFDLLLRLDQGRTSFRNALEAASGGSSRRALMLLQGVYPALPDANNYQSPVDSAERIKRSLQKIFARSILFRCVMVAASETRSFFKDTQKDSLVDGREGATAARLAARLIDAISSAISTLCESRHIAPSSLTYLEISELWDRSFVAETANYLRNQFGDAIYRVVGNSRDSRKIADNFSMVLIMFVLDGVKTFSRLSGLSSKAADHVLKSISAHLKTPDARIARNAVKEIDLESHKLFSPADRKSIAAQILRSNPRLAGMSFLLSSHYVADIFHNSDKHLTIAKLLVLHCLGNQEDNKLRFAKLLYELKQFDVGKELAKDTINGLVDADKRLVWITKAHQYNDYEEMSTDSEHFAHLTRSGWGYLQHLMFELPYLTNVFYDRQFPPRDQAELLDRFTICLQALQELHEEEMMAVKHRLAKVDGDEPSEKQFRKSWRNVGGFAVDIAAGASGDLSHACGGHIANLVRSGRSRSDLEDEWVKAKMLLEEWNLFIETSELELHSSFGQEVRMPSTRLISSKLIAARRLDGFSVGRSKIGNPRPFRWARAKRLLGKAVSPDGDFGVATNIPKKFR